MFWFNKDFNKFTKTNLLEDPTNVMTKYKKNI